MSPVVDSSVLRPFKVVSFRFQWPADLLTSWAFEMEVLILGWYVLVETGSVLWLTIFGALRFLGTLIAPLLGVLSDRLGRRTMLCALRATYAGLATALMLFALSGTLSPGHVFAIGVLAGLVRPSDLVMRNALIGDTMPTGTLMKAMAISRTTMDSARIAGALAGAALLSQLGIGGAYAVVTGFYVCGLALTLGVSGVRPNRDGAAPGAGASPWRELKLGFGYVRATPTILAAMWLAFLFNVTVFPIVHGILPYVARDVYRIDENGLGHLVASFALGALLGSITMVLSHGSRRPARFMIKSIWLAHIALLVFGQMQSKLPGAGVLALIGFTQSLSMISMSVTLLTAAGLQYRGLVMGVRMLAVYGMPIGLLAAGAFINWFGFAATVTCYSVVGLVASALVAFRWRRQIWWQ